MSSDCAIPKGSLVLVTGANGYIGSHIVECFLHQGYKVRGTVRSAAKIATLQARWNEVYGAGKFEVAIVEDMSKDEAFNEALKEVSGVVHVASNTSLSTKPADVIDPVVKATLSILQSASKQPSVKSFVLTSSIAAAVWPPSTIEFDVGGSSWNQGSVDKAYSLPDDDIFKSMHIYSASKALGEQAAWKFVKEQKPGFVLNTILPGANFGPILDPEQPATLAGALRDTFLGKPSFLQYLRPQWFVDVRDDALLHVRVLTCPPPGGERVYAVAAPFNYNDVLHTFRKLYPGKSFPEDIEGLARDLTRYDNKLGTELLGSWIGLEDCIKANTEGL